MKRNPNPTISRRWWVVWTVSMLLVTGHLVVQASPQVEVLSDTSIQTHDQRTLLLFPSHRFEQFFVRRPVGQMLQIDLPYFQAEPRLVVAPHPQVKLMRISQPSTAPEVARVSLLFDESGGRTPQLRDGMLYLVDAGPRTAVGAGGGQSGGGSAIPAALGWPPAPGRGGGATSAVARAQGMAGGAGHPLDQPVSIDFDNEDLMTILTALTRKYNLRLFADEGVRGKFSVHAQNIRLREVLKQLLLQRDFQYTLQGNNLTVISLNKSGRVARELLFKDLGLRDALQTLSKMMGVNLVIHESVTDRPVNFYVENLNLDELLEVLVSTNDLIKQPYNQNTFIIASKKEGGRFGHKVYRTFKLTNAKPEEIVSTIESNQALADRIDIKNITKNERINALSVFDTPENLELMQSIIDSVDEKLKQAVIELRLLEINRNSLKQLGISLEKYAVKVEDINRLPTSYPLAATLEFLESENKARVLASPKIRAIHGKPANIAIGEKLPVPYFRYENASNTYLGYTPQVYKEYRDLDVGISLEVTPEIHRDNEISLDIHTKVDNILSINADGQPHRSNRETRTTIRVKDGETVVMGGLIKQNETTAKQSPALLNKVPLFRSLLTQAKNDNQESEMIMLITPHLVNLDEPRAETGELSVARGN